uniref:DUF4408 domain-containing protein n=1 Tax=Kalanchoe fedtschenkoi TaxID=63787 RepID=A0A7N0TYD1_KALFE
MEFWKPDNVKTEQYTTMRFYSYKVGHLVKLLEISSALILVLWSTTRLPIAVKLLVEFGKQSCALLLSTPSVFLIGNAIVISLVGSFQSSSDSRTDLYEELVEESKQQREDDSTKQSICSDPETKTAASNSSAAAPASENESVGYSEVREVKCYRRTQSETLVRSDVTKELRRSRTGNGWMKREPAAEKHVEGVDGLSSDEFRRTVEAFIAKQQRFLRDENMALVLSH